MKLSVASSVFVNYSLPDAIRLVAQAGYEGIDIWGGRPHVYRKDIKPEELAEIRSLIRRSGLEPVSLMPAFFRYPHSLSSPNETVREDSLEYMYECLESAVALGAKILLIVPGRSLHGQSREEAWKWMVEGIARICERARQYDVRLGIEPANAAVTDLVNTAGDALAIIDELGYENLGIVLDSGHIHLSAERPEEAIRNACTLLLQVHVNDNDGSRQQNLIPGDGTFDFSSFTSLLKRSGFAGYLTIELAWDYSLDPFPPVLESKQRMINLLRGRR